MIVPLDPSAEMRDRLEAMGIGAIVIEPLGGHPPRGDFLSMMVENLERLEAGLSEAES